MIPLSVLRERLLLPESMTFDDYVDVDKDVQAHEELTEEELIAELQPNDFAEEEQEDDQETVDEREICSATDAKHFIDELRRFFEARSLSSDIEFSSICKLESALHKNVHFKQSSMRDFLQ